MTCRPPLPSSRGLSLRLALLLGLAGLMTSPARGANPASGTVTPSSQSVTYTGGPFANDNQLNEVGSVQGIFPPTLCGGDAAPCDDFALTVAIPPTDTTAYLVTVRVQWARPEADFDLFVLNSDGITVVGESATAADPETVIFEAVPRSTTGYVVRIVPFATDHTTDVYTATITLTPDGTPPSSPPPVAPPPSSPGVPRYQNYTPPAGSGLGINSGEPSIGVNWKTGKVFFQSDVQTLRVTFYDQLCAAFTKALWENKSPATSVQDSDPILFTDRQTGRTIAGMLLLLTGRNESSYTDNDGDLWVPSQGSSITSGVDHETIGGGPFAAPLTRDPNGPVYPDAVYYCSQDIATALCAVSADGGQTYGPAVPIYNLEQCGGLHGHVKVAPDGTVYVPNENCGGKQALVFSTNNGATWTISKVPDSSPGATDPSVGIGAKGTLYFGYQANGGHPKVAVGRLSGGAISWGPSQDVGTSFKVENTAFSAVASGDDDRAAFAFLGTPQAGDFEDQRFRGIWHLYVAHTFDGGTSWTTVDATPDDAVQRGCIWTLGGAVTCRNLLDFNDATVDAAGRVLIGYSDGCVGPCTDAPVAATGNSFTAIGAIARQSGGKRLFKQFDPVEPVLPGAPMVSALRDAAGVHLSWPEPDSGGSPITSYKVYRRASTSATRSLIGTAGTDRTFVDTTATAGVSYLYSVAAVTSKGTTPSCGLDASEVAPTDSPGSSCALPGVSVVTDPAGDQTGAPLSNADLDILSISIAEPYNAASPGDSTLVFTLKVAASVAAPPPLHQWRLIWNYPVGPNVPNIPFSGIYYVGMNTDSSGTVGFEYGTVEVQVIGLVLGNPITHKIGTVSGTHSADGTIQFVVPKALVGFPAPGDILGGIYARTFAGTADETMRSNTGIDTAGSPVGTYAVVGNLSCAPPGSGNCLEDDAPAIGYSKGWQQVKDSGASAGHFHVSTGKNATLALAIDVPSGRAGSLTYSYAKSAKGGSATVFLDGVSQGSISYSGSNADLHRPAFGFSVRYGGLASGRHTFELRNATGPMYVDQFCLEDAAAVSQPTAGPGSTSERTDALAAVQQVLSPLALDGVAVSLSVVAESSGNVPIQLVVLDPTGAIAAAADNSSGLAAVDVPVPAAGVYVVKIVNPGLAPVNVWSAATPLEAR